MKLLSITLVVTPSLAFAQPAAQPAPAAQSRYELGLAVGLNRTEHGDYVNSGPEFEGTGPALDLAAAYRIDLWLSIGVFASYAQLSVDGLESDFGVFDDVVTDRMLETGVHASAHLDPCSIGLGLGFQYERFDSRRFGDGEWDADPIVSLRAACAIPTGTRWQPLIFGSAVFADREPSLRLGVGVRVQL